MASSSGTPIECIDTLQYGVPGRGAAYVLRGKRVAVVEAGTPRAADILLERLRGDDLAYIFVTHIHLDHAGAAGRLAAEHPEATVVAHPRALRHLADPSRLIEGVRQASPDLFPLYGEPLPVPEAQLHATEDDETYDLGSGVCVRALHTTGHAPHHLCFLETPSRTLFAGDAVGNLGIPFDVPLTVPPRFDIDASRATLARLRNLEPSALAFTHFGVLRDGIVDHIDGYERQIDCWFDRIARLRREADADGVIKQVLDEAKYEEIDPTDRLSIEMCVRGALLTLEAAEAA